MSETIGAWTVARDRECVVLSGPGVEVTLDVRDADRIGAAMRRARDQWWREEEDRAAEDARRRALAEGGVEQDDVVWRMDSDRIAPIRVAGRYWSLDGPSAWPEPQRLGRTAPPAPPGRFPAC